MSAQIRKFSEVAMREMCRIIKDKSGIPMTSMYHCGQLSLKLLLELNKTISEFTIARVFGVLKTKSVPSVYTLDILSDYIGFESWDVFYVKHFDEMSEGENCFTHPKSDFLVSKGELMLLKYTLEEESYRPVVRYLEQKFSDLNLCCPTVFNEGIWELSTVVGNHISKATNSEKEFMSVISKNDNIRTPFFNYWVDMDGLDTYYDSLLENSFVKNIKPTSADFAKDEIWFYCIRMYHAIYTLNKSKLLKFGYQLMKKYSEAKVNISLTPYLYPIYRFHAMHIVYQHYSEPKTPFDWYERKMIDYDDDIYGVDKLESVFKAGFFSEALFIANQYKLMLECFSKPFYNLKENYLKQNPRNNHLSYEVIQFVFYYHISYFYIHGAIEYNESKGFVYNNEIKTKELDNAKLIRTYYSNMIQSVYIENVLERKQLFKSACCIARKLKYPYFEEITKKVAHIFLKDNAG
jgi:hypothetical protein